MRSKAPLWGVSLAGIATAWVGFVALFARAAPLGKIREAAVAGLFYPAEREALAGEVRRLLAAAPALSLPPIRALVVPHAGYAFSGPTAAFAYRQLVGRDYRRVILLACSHYAVFEGAMIPAVEAFATPLGSLRLAPQAAELAKRPPFSANPPARVQRPAWSWQSPLKVPPGEDDPHTWDHTIEVQLPFLQTVLPRAQIVPAMYGQIDPAAAAKEIGRFLDDATLIIVSSDLSHYHPDTAARALDQRCVQAMLALDSAAMNAQEACGQLAIMTLLEIARQRGWQGHLLDYRNSGNASGDKKSVVGYASVAFTDAKGQPTPPGPLSAEDGTGVYAPEARRQILALARATIVAVAAGKPAPVRREEEFLPALRAKKGCFVTLTRKGDLRGCIGHLVPQEALWKAVMDNAQSAAFRDGRFPPVTKGEMKEIAIEISVLSEPQPLAFASPEDLVKKLRPGVDGVILRFGDRMATYLPQVWEHFSTADAFLSSLAQKAGCAGDAWRGAGVEAQIYQVESFHE